MSKAFFPPRVFFFYGDETEVKVCVRVGGASDIRIVISLTTYNGPRN